MIKINRAHALALVAILGIVATAFVACSNESPTAPTPPSNSQNGSTCSAQGNGNTVNCAPATPTPTPSEGVCVAQTGPFTCGPAASQFRAVVESCQAKTPDAPEVIYLANTARCLNDLKDPNGKRLYCAVVGFPLSTDELAIKAVASNASSETLDLKRADGATQTLHVSTCNPARF